MAGNAFGGAPSATAAAEAPPAAALGPARVHATPIGCDPFPDLAAERVAEMGGCREAAEPLRLTDARGGICSRKDGTPSERDATVAASVGGSSGIIGGGGSAGSGVAIIGDGMTKCGGAICGATMLMLLTPKLLACCGMYGGVVA